jgi:hypothetical protein
MESNGRGETLAGGTEPASVFKKIQFPWLLAWSPWNANSWTVIARKLLF